MAEGTTDDTSSAGLCACDGTSSRQSKSSSASFLEFRELEETGEAKNSVYLVCRSCRCKVLKPGYATLVEREARMCV